MLRIWQPGASREEKAPTFVGGQRVFCFLIRQGGLIGGEIAGLYYLAASRERMRPGLVLRHGFGGAAVGAGKALLPRHPCRAAFLLVREPCPASHVVSLSCPDTQTLLPARIRVGVMKQ